MYTDILRGMKIIVTILRAAPVVTVARITIITAWDIFRSIAMVMAVPILTSISRKTTRIAAVAMTMLHTRSMSMESIMRMSVAVDTSITITSMKSMMTMNAAVDTSITIMSMMTMNAAVDTSIITTSTRMMGIMYLVTPMTANASFAILTKSIVMFVAKA